MKAIPEAGYQKEVFRTGMIAGNLTSLADHASSDFRRWNCRQSQLATPGTREPAIPNIPGQTSQFVKQKHGLCNFFVRGWRFTEPTKPDYAEGHFSDIWWTQHKREQILQSLWCADNRSPSHPGTSPAFSEHTHIAHYAHFHVQPSFMAGVVILSYSNIGHRISGTFLLRLRKRPFSKPDTRCMKSPENLPHQWFAERSEQISGIGDIREMSFRRFRRTTSPCEPKNT